MNTFSKIDLHVHTCHSNSAGNWLLSKIGARESYTTPQQVIDMAAKRGMDWITITDHDTISGALEVAHLPNFFISEEITTYFPEDKTRIHVVALNITEKQHTMIQLIRADVYELVDYLNSEAIVHFVAHPFFRMTGPLSLSHLEKMFLLFKRFEVKNGGKQIDPDDLLIRLLNGLTQQTLWKLSEKYNINPVGHQPWQKFMVGGSDDHGGIHIGLPHTQCPKSETVSELMAHLAHGRSEVCGQGGSPQTVAHAIMAVSYQCLKSNRNRVDPIKSDIAWNVLEQLLDNTSANRSLSLISAFLLQTASMIPDIQAWPSWLPALPKAAHSLLKGLEQQPEMNRLLKQGLDFQPENNDALYRFIKYFVQNLFQKTIDDKDTLTSKQLLKNIALMASVILPYLIAYKTEYRDRPMIRQAKQKYGGRHDAVNAKIAAFSDFDSQKTARSRSLSLYLRQEFDLNIPVQVLGIGSADYTEKSYHNLHAIADFPFRGQTLPVPDLLDVGEWLFEDDYDTLYLHSLGPMGLLGFCLGKWMGIKVIGRLTYAEINRLLRTLQNTQGQIAQKLLTLIFSQMDQVRVSSKEARDLAIQLNIHPSKIMFVGTPIPGLLPETFLDGFQPPNFFNPFQPFEETNHRIQQ